MDKLERHTKFIEGKSAIDFEVTDPAGNRKKLSDYKGKVMYIDVWATWCGPCRLQAPVFKKLSEKYQNIHFISLSVDEKKTDWDKEMKNKTHGKITELWAEPDMRKKWEISSIPRFLLIDKDFNIIYAETPRPSDTKYIEPLLEKYDRF
jgi:thiol-disulfide isomerase/thioredoxin